MSYLAQQEYFVGGDHLMSQVIHRTLASLHTYSRQFSARIPWLLHSINQNGTTADQASQSSESAISAAAAPKLLVVEDECIVALDLMSTLVQMGYCVTGHALSGDEALEEAAKSQPNLVLMDIRLKGNMDGIEAAEQIRARLGIPVIFLTAFSDDTTLHRAKTARMAGFLHKPFSKYQLEEAILSALRNSANE